MLTARDGEELRVRLREDGRLDDQFVASRIQHWFGSPGRTARLVSSGSHLWDFADAPISIINLATVRDIARVAKTPLDPRRFRANLYVDGLPRGRSSVSWAGDCASARSTWRCCAP